VLGARFDLTLLEKAADVDTDDLLGSLDRLQKAGVIQDDDCRMEYMAFRHTLMHEAVLQDLLAADRRRRHAQVLAAAEELVAAGREVPVDQLVHHAMGAGDRASGFRHSLAAARASMSLGGYGEALEHYGRAADLNGGTEPERAQLALEHGRLLGRVGHAGTAVERLAVAREVFLATGNHVGAAVALSAAGEIRGQLGEAEAGLRDLRRAGQELPSDAPLLARLRVAAALAKVLMLRGDPGAVPVARQALALIPPSPSREEVLEAVHLLASLGCAWWPTDPDAARSSLEESLTLARRIGDHTGVLRACNNLAHLMSRDGHPDEVARLRGEALAIAREHGLRHDEAWQVVATADDHLRAGHLDEARQALTLGERLMPQLPASVELPALLLEVRAREALVAGRFDEADRRLEEAGPALLASGREGAALGCRLLRAVAQLGGGDREAACRRLSEAVSALGDVDPEGPDVVLAALGGAAVCGDPGVAAALADLVPRWPSPALESLVTALRELAAGGQPSPGAIEQGAGDLERRGLAWSAALVRVLGGWALAGAAGSTEAVALARSARAWFQAIDAPGWSRVADEVLRRLGRRAPTRLGSGALGLTAREVEVLALLADGATNRQIAELLVITPPTAARHVANIFTKLGVNSRAQAARVAAEGGLLAEGAAR
jgi:DNA-binding CsgD family transcriptional regulator/tetratricopeptide (TPR) repeat protein